MENNNPLPKENTQIQLVVNQPDTEDDTIDLGRVFHNMKVKSRIFAWVLVLCLVVGVSAPILLYQFQKTPLTVTSVVTLRYEVPEGKGGTLVTPDGEDLDLNAVTSTPVLQKALENLTLSQPLTIEMIRNNMRVTRVLTEDSSRTQEILSGLAEAKDKEAYSRLEEAKIEYQNRFIVSLSNSFAPGNTEETSTRYDLKDEELRILLNRILDAYNSTLVRQYADVRLPEDTISMIDTEELDIPEVLDSLNTALNSMLTYCADKPDAVKEYRSWQTGMTLNEWMESIRTLKSVSIDYLDAHVYSRGIMRDKDAVALTYRYRIRTLQSDLEKVQENIANTETLLKNYKNNEVYVSMQESDSARTTKMTTAYYNSLVLQQQAYYVKAASIRTEIAETQNKLDRLAGYTLRSEIKDVEQELANAASSVKGLYESLRTHMMELFESPLYTTYSENSAPQGETENFLKASSKKMIIFGAVGAVLACGLWFLAALAPEFRRNREDDDPKAKAEGKEAAEV